MNIISKIAFDPSRPIIARSAGRGMIGSINFTMVNLLQQALRAKRSGTVVIDPSIDTANGEIAADHATAETTRVRAEQGFKVDADPMMIAQLLKSVREMVNEDLIIHAGRREMVTAPGSTIPDPFHIGADFAESIDFQIRTTRPVSEALIKAEAKALNISEEDVRMAVTNRDQRQANYLKANRDELIAAFNAIVADHDGESAFDKLPALYRIRLAAAADKGLFGNRSREIERHLNNNVDAAGNIAMIDGTRREILDEVGRELDKPEVKREIDEEISRGRNMPTFAPRPHVQAAEAKTEAMQKHAKAA